MLKVLVLLVCLGAVFSQKARFDNYSVYRVKPDTQGQLEALQELHRNSNGLDFWGPYPRDLREAYSVMVPPHRQPDFVDFLERTGTENQLAVSNLQEKFDKQTSPDARSESFGWTSYHNLTEINAWLDLLVAQYPHVTLEVGGQSSERREIRGVKVTYGPNNPSVFIEAGIHANEWLGPATATYVLNQVLTNTDPEVRAVVQEYNWYVFPSFNPDGYEYTHTTDRTWRKTRSDSGMACRGADLNRNWDFHWMENEGASNDSCSRYFAGTSPFSEPEADSLQKYLSTIGSEIKVYLAFHTYSQLILLPHGHTSERIKDYDQLMGIGNRAAEKLKQRHGTIYKVGNIVDLLYKASGGSTDWMKGTFDTPVPYTLELRDTGAHGYYLPTEQILPTGEETFDAVLSIIQDARDLPFSPAPVVRNRRPAIHP